mgnify:CR=1 FL=1
MADLTGFNAREVDPATDFEPIPPGKYTAIITGSEMKPTKDGAGRYLEVAFQVAEGEHKGRMLWARLNLENASEQAVRIARGELSAVCRAVNVLEPKDSLELHDIPLTVKVGLKKRSDTGELGNVIKGYERRGVASASPNGAAPRPAANTAGASTPPWKR